MYQAGDVVLINSKTPLGFIQRWIYKKFLKFDTNVTHIGIIYDDRLFFEMGTKARFMPISKLNGKNFSVIRFTKPYNFTESTKEKLRLQCDFQTNHVYDYPNLISALLYIITGKYIKLSSKKQYICSEFAFKCLYNLSKKQKQELFGETDQQKIYPYHFAKLKNHPNVRVVSKSINFTW